ncbi:DUF6895 family protein [Streptomyces syringium]|uniref:DUF6895 family protein n=1 Tax=Streptomyces syringium TaxID=76729 RepID=UPI0033E4474A
MNGETVDVARTGEAALRWLSRNRAGFCLGDDVLDAATEVDRTLKPLGELAQVCVCVCRHTRPGTPHHRLAAELLTFAWDQTDHGALFLELQRLEPAGTYPLEFYAAFASAGLRHSGFEEFAATVAATRGWRATEQYPNRLLGVLNTERRTGLPAHEEDGTVLCRTWLGSLPEPWMFERGAGYSATHVIFHLTDWGRAVHQVPSWLACYLETWLPPWLDTCLDAGQWDLSCELLAVAASLPSPPDRAMVEGAWDMVADAQEPSGALAEVGPAPHRPALPLDFLHCYHSTLMAAYAAALTSARLDCDAMGGQGLP